MITYFRYTDLMGFEDRLYSYRFLKWILLVVAIYITFPNRLHFPVDINLDDSWRLALQNVFERRLVVGKDFVFTYGPLGFLSARVPSEETKYIIATYDFFVVAQLVAVYCVNTSVFQSFRFLLIHFYLFFLLAIGSVPEFRLQPPVLLFSLSVYWMLLAAKFSRRSLIILAVANSLLCFYIKLNLGLIALLLLFASTFQQYLKSKQVVLFAVEILLLVLAVLVSSLLFNVALYEYILSSLHIIVSYNDAMFTPLMSETHSLFYLALIAVFLLCAAILRTAIVEKSYYLCSIALLFGFLLFKQGFVRADTHILEYFNSIFLPAAILAFFSERRTREFNTMILIFIGVISTAVNKSNVGILIDSSANIREYFGQLAAEVKESKINSGISATMLTEIGDSSIDIFPTLISRLILGDLRYHGRPVMQSYSAYDSYLDSMNAEFFSRRQTKKIIYEHDCIDRRYCFFDDSRAKISILENYEVSLTEADRTLLSLNSAPKFLQLTPNHEGNFVLGDSLVLTSTDLPQFIHFDIKYSILGHFRRIFFQPPQLTLVLGSDQGDEPFRAVVPILRGGVFANYFINSNDAASKFFRREFSQLKPVRRIRLVADEPSMFDLKVSYRVSILEPRERK